MENDSQKIWDFMSLNHEYPTLLLQINRTASVKLLTLLNFMETHVVVGVLETPPSILKEHFGKIGIETKIVIIQSARILRKVSELYEFVDTMTQYFLLNAKNGF